jgi:ketosteroid isomerase-like protein
MEGSDNNTTKSVELVALVYDSLQTRNFQKLQEIVTRDVTWNVTEGFSYSGVYTGLDNVLRGFYGRLKSGLDRFSTEKVKWIDAGQNVIVLGYYLMTAKGETEEHRIRFAHIWGIQDGKVTGVWQVADTAKLPQTLQPDK